MAHRIIFHIDMDAFFASVEQKMTRQLIGKPVIVGADPKDGKGRGVVSSPSYEARRFGVKSGMPISQAYRICPTAVYLRPNMPLYVETSERIMRILRGYAERFEQVSIDEAFLDVSGRINDFDTAENFAMAIKSEIIQKESLTCSIGIGDNKLIAKIASEIKKPDGLIIVMPKDVEKFLEPLPVQKIPGIGPKTSGILERIGIKTIGDLQRYPLNELTRAFGQNYGGWLYSKSHGIDNSPLGQVSTIKSINRNVTFEYDTDDIKLMHTTIEEMARDVYESLTANNFSYKTVSLRVRYDNFNTFTRDISLPNPTDKPEQIISICKELLNEFLGKRKIRQLGIRLSNLAIMHGKQKSILEF